VRRSSGWAWGLAAAALGLAAFAVVLNAYAGPHGDPWWRHLAGVTVVLGEASIGLLIALRRGHPIGWLLLGGAVLLASFGVAQSYAQYALLEDPGALPGPEWAVLWDQSAWPLLFGVIVAIALVFPDGRLPSPRWRKVAIGSAAAFALLVLTFALEPEPFEAPYEHVDRPLPELPEALAVLFVPGFLGAIASLVAAVRAVRLRFRSAVGVERLQLKWLAYSLLLVPATLLVCLGGALVGGVEGEDAFQALFFLMLGAIPTSVGLAVLRYRLYEIDLLINRTLVYGVLTSLLAAAYAAMTLVLGTALGSGSAWTTAGATLTVAAAFRPLRARVQDLVDRRFSRARYHALRRIGAFLEALRAGRAAPEEIEPLLREILSDPTLDLRFYLPDSQIYVDARGRESEDRRDDRRQRTLVERAGQPLGVVLHAPVGPERPGLLATAVEAAGLALEIARLRVELRRQLEEVEASRARIVSAGYEERRRIERDLHDGAQQRLVSIGLQLRHVQHELGPVTNGAGEALDDVVAELGRAIGDLRKLAGGVRPAALDRGLASALRELAARAPVPVELNTPGERFPDELEAAAYFVASEGLTNAIKHSHASKVALTAQRWDGTLLIEVADNGVGGADSAGAGSGLRGLSDRVAAHGGTLDIKSDPGAGTTLRAELPCAS
jgi:signal transduction histidine kinase